MIADKFRFRFTKSGTLRLVSHHDLMRCTERMLRRAAIPFKSSAGFHPTPRVIFALSLPLGIIGREEVVELELTEPRDGHDLLDALNSQAPAGLRFTAVAAVPMKTTARVRRVVYEMPIPPERVSTSASAAAALLAEEKVWVERLRPNPKRLNIRPYLRNITVENQLRLDLWVSQDGTARAEELLQLLGIDDLLESGAVLHRTVVELHDEVSECDPADMPPTGAAEQVPLRGADAAACIARERLETKLQTADVGANWGASPSGPVVE